MDLSRYYLDARTRDPDARIVASFLPDTTREQLDAQLQGLGNRKVATHLATLLPDRLAETLCHAAGLPDHSTGSSLRKDHRRALLDAVCEHPLPVTRSRGFTHAETTAGGVPLDEVNIKTMQSRRTPGAYLCGEILDVDGRIGGFNFQWAWATGHLAGTAAARAVLADAPTSAHK